MTQVLTLEVEEKTEKEKSKKFYQKRQDIINLAKQYVDNTGKVNMTNFRKENPLIYSRLNYYFNGVGGLLNELKQFTNSKEEKQQKRASGRGCAVNIPSVRNELALDMLLLLRKNYTLHEIGEMYGASRSHIHQLIQMMDGNTYLESRPVKLEMLI